MSQEPMIVSDAAKQALHDALKWALDSVLVEWPSLVVDRVEVHIPAAAVTLRFSFDDSKGGSSE